MCRVGGLVWWVGECGGCLSVLGDQSFIVLSQVLIIICQVLIVLWYVLMVMS